ncbi:aminotransferase class IV [Phycisphaerales bacterium AB-hyl4]|uniref:Aminotransferase class IV n=1 Tax=Natronomicrosphaera hydrolytica TaxID=3242702 RepID=A0ABV4U0I1_9BACT
MNATSPATLVYLNGEFLPYDQASLSIDDRGTLFSDGVYEVLEYFAGRPFAMQQHVDRLKYSLAGICIDPPSVVDELPAISDELIRRNDMPDARVYWQVTRGPAPRNHLPPSDPTPTVLVTTTPTQPLSSNPPARQWKAITHEDLRWKRCCYKTLMLLPNTLAKQQAKRDGCQEAILHQGVAVTEGGSTNVFVVRDGELWTHPANEAILRGITRDLVIDYARAMDLTVHETAVTLDELRQADEVFVTGTTTHVTAITHIDGHPIQLGEVGPVTASLHDAYEQQLMQACCTAGQTSPHA